MARPPAISPQAKAELVLAVLSSRVSVAEAARKAGVSGQAVSNWRRQFVEAGIKGLEGGDRQSTERERQLRAEVVELKKALGEVYIQLRAQRALVDGKNGIANSRRGYASSANISRYRSVVSS
ncbi:helix-turn-helix domain-containing protein [Streptomyces sp. NPDC006385]|uniref:helix-turn-helix domain-containing protein n=1 Tax=Streptomyces sp. NPDC006385 TaxID=3156761 RepID=UPI0033A5D44C